MYRSTDGGSTWANYPLPFGSNYALSLWFNNPLIGVAGSSTTSIARTTDGGATWSPITMPGPGTWGLTGFDSTFFAVNWATIYASTDNGVNWSVAYQPGVGQLSDISFFKRSDVTRAWAIGGYGAIATYYQGPTSGGEEPIGTPTDFVLFQNYPNPFNPTTEIRYQLPQTSRITLKIIDVVGRKVTTLVDGVEEAGEKSVKWDASGFASGVYIYRLEAGSFVEARKLVLMK
jgi:hypothetical protein